MLNAAEMRSAAFFLNVNKERDPPHPDRDDFGTSAGKLRNGAVYGIMRKEIKRLLCQSKEQTPGSE